MQDKTNPPPKSRAALIFGINTELIVLLFVSRLVVDTSTRLFMPFLAEISSGLGLTIASFSWVLTIRALMGLVSPMVGALADRHGRRLIMTIAMTMRAVAVFWLSFSTGWWSLLPMLLLSLAAAGFYPVLRAYISDLVSSERRGRALAAVDASFPTAGIIGLPFVGWLIEISSWRLPLLVIAGLSLINALIIGVSLPKSHRKKETGDILAPMRSLVKQPCVLASMAVSTLLLNIFTLFTLFWAFLLKERFFFSPLQIGVTGTAIGIAELFGLILAGIFIDRLGKRQGTLLGLGISMVFFLCILPLQGSLPAVLLLLVLFTISLEFAVTSSIPLIAEQALDYRATLFCMVSFGNTLGEGISPPLATFLWTRGGPTAVIVMGAGLIFLAYMLAKRFLFDSLEDLRGSDCAASS